MNNLGYWSILRKTRGRGITSPGLYNQRQREGESPEQYFDERIFLWSFSPTVIHCTFLMSLQILARKGEMI